jgi:hypothetical protein
MKPRSLVDIHQPLGVTVYSFFRLEELANIYQTARPYILAVRTSGLRVYAGFISSLFDFHSCSVFASVRNICCRYGLCRLPYYGAGVVTRFIVALLEGVPAPFLPSSIGTQHDTRHITL